MRVLGYFVPSSSHFRTIEFSDTQIDLAEASVKGTNAAIDATIKAEEAVIKLYKEIIAGTSESDPCTCDLITQILAEEEEHLRVMQDLLGM